MHIVQVVTCPSNVKNGQSNITLVGYHGQPKFTSNIVHCPYKVPNCLDHHISTFKIFLMGFTL